MKITKQRLKEIIKEELSSVLREGIEATWKNYEEELEDLDDLYMWLNEAGSPEDLTRYADKLGGDVIRKIVSDNNIKFPIRDINLAVKLYELTKQMARGT